MHYATIVSGQLATTQTGRPVDKRAMGRETNVRYLIEGDVRTEGDTVRLMARLVDANSATQLWSDRFDVARSQWHAEADGAVWAFAGRLRGALWNAESRRVARETGTNRNAIDLVVRGYLAYDGSLKGTLEARKFFDEALRLDPTFATALSQRASIAWSLSKLDPKADRAQLAQEMDEFARRAVASDRADANAWLARAWALLMQWRWDAALEANAEAMRVDPTLLLAPTHQSVDVLNDGKGQ
jgi:adenylate cyclase